MSDEATPDVQEILMELELLRNAKDELEQQNSLLLEKAEKLENENRTITEQNTKLQEENDKILTENKSQNTKLQEENDKLLSENKAQNTKLQEENEKLLSDQITKLQEENEKLLSENKALKEQGKVSAADDRQVSNLTQKNELQQRELEELKKRVQHLTEEVSNYQNKLEDANRRAEDAELQVLVLKKKEKSENKEAPKEHSKPSADFEYNVDLGFDDPVAFEINAYKTHTLLQKRNEELHEKLKETIHSLTEAEKDIKDLRDELNKKVLENEEQKIALTNNAVEIKELQSNVSKLSGRLESDELSRKEAEKNLSIYKQKIDILEQKNFQLKQDASDLPVVLSKNEGMDKRIQELEESNRSFSLKIEQVQAELADRKAALLFQREKLKDRYQLRVDLLQEELKEEQEKVGVAQREVERLKEHVTELNLKINEQQKNNIQEKKSGRVHDRKLNEVEKRVSEKEDEIQNLKFEIKRLQEKVETLRKTVR